MKSLEYVKKMREDLNQCFRHGNPATLNNEHEIYHKEWETIQQSLEVLEIIRKKKVDVLMIHMLLKTLENIEDVLWRYNILELLEERNLTIEELLKLKQWLEDK